MFKKLFSPITTTIGRFINYCQTSARARHTDQLRGKIQKHLTLNKQMNMIEGKSEFDARYIPSSYTGFNPPDVSIETASFFYPKKDPVTEAKQQLARTTEVVYHSLDNLIEYYETLELSNRIETAEKFYKQIEDWSKADAEERQKAARLCPDETKHTTRRRVRLSLLELQRQREVAEAKAVASEPAKMEATPPTV